MTTKNIEFIYDSEGNLIGVKEESIITKEQMMELLKQLDNKDPSNV